MNIIIHDREYRLGTTLRVAYEMQGQHNHKPYSEIFQSLGSMGLEDQIGLIYCSFKVANPEAAKELSKREFTEYYLDNFTLKEVMGQIKAIVEGITGERVVDEVPESAGQGN